MLGMYFNNVGMFTYKKTHNLTHLTLRRKYVGAVFI